MFHLYDTIRRGGVYVIAEMSANHGGKLENALEIVRRAAESGADCVKIQTYTADSITMDCDNDYFRIRGGLWDGYRLYDLYREAGTPYEWHETIRDECARCGVDFLSTPFDRNAADFLESLGAEAYKIASFELVDIPLISYVAAKGKPMLISCGMGSAEEIQDAIDACREAGNEQIVLFKCCSEYPAQWENMRLANILDMIRRFGVPVGLSDHSAGSLAAVVGASMGACVIEKHVKLDGVESADSKFSMTMEEFAAMVRDLRNAATIRGEVRYGPAPGEVSNVVFKRSLFAVADIPEGETVTENNVRSIRPGYGIAPKYLKEMLGRRAGMSLKRGEPVTREFLEALR